ncbi:MAG: carboxymuconolactone decarboxylase family protein [Lacibacter sp.]
MPSLRDGILFLNKFGQLAVIFEKIPTMGDLIKEFNDYRTKMNEVILSKDNLVIKRLWNLDTNTYAEGALSTQTKEMLGLVASMVLRCDDCIKYHLGKCYELGVTTRQMYEIFAVANIVGGTIVIPHTRRAAEYWEELNKQN